MKKLFIFVLFFPIVLFGQQTLLQNGPMLGYLTMHEVMFWLQTTQSAHVKIAYYPVDKPDEVEWTDEVVTTKDKAFTAHLIGDKIKPATKYHYDVYIDGKKVELDFPTEFKTKQIWAYRTEPPEFSFAAGSGTYVNDPQWDRPGKVYGGGYEIYRSIYQKHPDFMIWLGDNVYLRQNEWNSWTGIVYRYTHDR
jgi:alkaline phosphatase D